MANRESDASLLLWLQMLGDDSLRPPIRAKAARELIARFERWAGRSDAGLRADAVQQLIVLLLEGRSPAFVETDHMVAWCRTVLRNHVASEIRKRRAIESLRNSVVAKDIECESGVESWLSAAELVERALHEIAGAAPSKRTSCRLSLVNWFVADVYGFGHAVCATRPMNARLRRARARSLLRRILRPGYGRSVATSQVDAAESDEKT